MDVGHVFSLQKAKFNLENLSPQRMLQNAKRIVNPFQPRSMVEFAKSILKLVIEPLLFAFSMSSAMMFFFSLLIIFCTP